MFPDILSMALGYIQSTIESFCCSDSWPFGVKESAQKTMKPVYNPYSYTPHGCRGSTHIVHYCTHTKPCLFFRLI